jgi:uncharacterized protein YdeI (BOF family)
VPNLGFMQPVFRLVLLILIALVTAAPAEGGTRDSFIDRPKPLVMTTMGRTNLLLAGMGISIHRLENLPEGRRVRLSGKVDHLKGSRLFTLRDDTGRVDVVSPASLPEDIKQGQEVSVAGRVRHGIFGMDIKATSIRPLNDAPRLVFEKKPSRAVLASAR